MDPRIKQIRQILDALGRVENDDNDTKEIVYDEELAKIKNLDRDDIIEVVKKAVGVHKRRKRYSPFVFSELTDVPGIEKVFGELLESADDVGRADIIQTIGLRKMNNLVQVLNRHFYVETDEFCKDMTLHVLGKIADESSMPIFVELMLSNDSQYQWRILSAGTRFANPKFHDYLERVFTQNTTQSSEKILAAWGLVKLGEPEPYKYLISMLDDPQITEIGENARSYDPGQSIRAAQAIADIKGWKFEWGQSSVPEIKAKMLADANVLESR